MSIKRLENATRKIETYFKNNNIEYSVIERCGALLFFKKYTGMIDNEKFEFKFYIDCNYIPIITIYSYNYTLQQEIRKYLVSYRDLYN